jgi:hypothetical protein
MVPLVVGHGHSSIVLYGAHVRVPAQELGHAHHRGLLNCDPHGFLGAPRVPTDNAKTIGNRPHPNSFPCAYGHVGHILKNGPYHPLGQGRGGRGRVAGTTLQPPGRLLSRHR